MKILIQIVIATFTLSVSAQPSNWGSQPGQNPAPVYPSVGLGDNAGFGDNALNNLPGATYQGCTSLGYYSLFSNYLGNENSSAGAEAMYNNYNSRANTAVGRRALYSNDVSGLIGDQNTAIGISSLYSNDGGNSNTAVGAESLYDNTFGQNNTAVGFRSLKDNSGSGGVYGIYNTAGGAFAMQTNINGQENTAFGYEALNDLRFGSNNVAIGAKAMYTSDYDGIKYAMHNTAIGHEVLYNSLAGWYNVAIGKDALWSDYDGFYNTAVGMYAGWANNNGSTNTSAGMNALSQNVNGDGNTAAGNGALASYLGDYNTAAGYIALSGLSTASSEYNAAAGYQTFQSSSAGDHNTIIGAQAEISGAFSNCSALGYGSLTGQSSSDEIWLGNSSITEIRATVAPVSDGRFKFNVSERGVKGLEFIMKLRPVTYYFDREKLFNHMWSAVPNETRAKKSVQFIASESEPQLNTGFIAQEVEAAAAAVSYDFDGVAKPKSESDTYGLSYDVFVVPLVKALQEQQSLILKEEKRAKELALTASTQLNTINNFLGKTEPLIKELDANPEFLLSFTQVKNSVMANLKTLAPFNGNISIYSINGSFLKSINASCNSEITEVDLGILSANNYLVVISEGNSIIAARKFTVLQN